MLDILIVKMEFDEDSQTITPPFGILYLASALEKAGFRVEVFHEFGGDKSIQRLKEIVFRKQPVFVGLSTLTGKTIHPSIEASKAIKSAVPVPIVWGGLHPTILPEQTLINDYIDIVAIGEGEKTVVELAEALSSRGLDPDRLAKIEGIAFKNGSQFVRTPPRAFIKDIDDLYPAWHLVDHNRYFYTGNPFYKDHGFQISEKKVGAIFSSRGCPWRCGFCYNQVLNKRLYRANSAQRVIKDIQTYKEKYGITAVVFYDDYFFSNRKRALEIVRNIGIPWSANLRADHMAEWGDEFAQEVISSGCGELRIAAESGSQKVLDIMKKDITVEQHRRSVGLCVKYGIPVTVAFMVGLPGETWSDTLETLSYIDELASMGKNVRVLGPGIYMPYPGTPLYDIAVKEYGFASPTSLEAWSDCTFGPKQPVTKFLDKRSRFLAYYKALNYRADLDQLSFSMPVRILRYLARFRWKHRFFNFPIDYKIPAFIKNKLNELGLSGTYNKLQNSMWKN